MLSFLTALSDILAECDQFLFTETFSTLSMTYTVGLIIPMYLLITLTSPAL